MGAGSPPGPSPRAWLWRARTVRRGCRDLPPLACPRGSEPTPARFMHFRCPKDPADILTEQNRVFMLPSCQSLQNTHAGVSAGRPGPWTEVLAVRTPWLEALRGAQAPQVLPERPAPGHPGPAPALDGHQLQEGSGSWWAQGLDPQYPDAQEQCGRGDGHGSRAQCCHFITGEPGVETRHPDPSPVPGAPSQSQAGHPVPTWAALASSG